MSRPHFAFDLRAGRPRSISVFCLDYFKNNRAPTKFQSPAIRVYLWLIFFNAPQFENIYFDAARVVNYRRGFGARNASGANEIFF